MVARGLLDNAWICLTGKRITEEFHFIFLSLLLLFPYPLFSLPPSPPLSLSLTHSMSQWSLNCYLYAPKDDDKHRASWRELYLLEEAGKKSSVHINI